MVVFYREANDAMGKYRWWTYEMQLVGQFSHADTVEGIKQQAAATITLVDRTDFED